MPVSVTSVNPCQNLLGGLVTALSTGGTFIQQTT